MILEVRQAGPVLKVTWVSLSGGKLYTHAHTHTRTRAHTCTYGPMHTEAQAHMGTHASLHPLTLPAQVHTHHTLPASSA